MIRSFNVSYPDFQLGEIINPDEFDVNNADIVIRINQIIDVLNQITDGIGGNGADIIHIGDVAPFMSERLQTFLQELVDQLVAKDENSGASFIGSLPISGIDGDTVQEQLFSLTTLFKELREHVVAEIARVDGDIAEVDTRTSLLEAHATVVDERLDTLGDEKADKADTYTKEESDKNVSQLEATIHDEFYTKEQADTLFDGKLTVGDDHVGTWQGLTPETLGDAIGVSDVVISNTEPGNPTERMLWFNPSRNLYTIYLDGRWRFQTAPTRLDNVFYRVVLDSESDTVSIDLDEFNPSLDTFIVFQNSTLSMKNINYTVGADNRSIVKTSGTWEVGTVFDFVITLSIPITE